MPTMSSPLKGKCAGQALAQAVQAQMLGSAAARRVLGAQRRQRGICGRRLQRSAAQRSSRLTPPGPARVVWVWERYIPPRPPLRTVTLHARTAHVRRGGQASGLAALPCPPLPCSQPRPWPRSECQVNQGTEQSQGPSPQAVCTPHATLSPARCTCGSWRQPQNRQGWRLHAAPRPAAACAVAQRGRSHRMHLHGRGTHLRLSMAISPTAGGAASPHRTWETPGTVGDSRHSAHSGPNCGSPLPPQLAHPLPPRPPPPPPPHPPLLAARVPSRAGWCRTQQAGEPGEHPHPVPQRLGPCPAAVAAAARRPGPRAAQPQRRRPRGCYRGAVARPRRH